MRALLCLAGLLLAAPVASACSLAVPTPLEELAWTGRGELVGSTDLFWRGVVDLDRGVAAPAWPDPAALSPDGRYVVFARAGEDVQTGPSRTQDTCGFYLSRHLVAYDRDLGTFALVDEGPVWGFADTQEGILSFDGGRARLLAWGSWAQLGDEPAPHVVRELQYRAPLVSPDGRAYVDFETGDLRALDGSVLVPLLLEADRLVHVAFEPSGAHVATFVETGVMDELRIHRLADGALVERMDLPRAWRQVVGG